MGESGHACGGASGAEWSGFPALVEVAGTARSVVGKGLRLSGIEGGALVEVVGEGFVGDLVVFPTVGSHIEFGLGWSPGGVDQRGRGGLADVGQDPGDGIRVGQEGDEREGRVAGGTDEGKDFIDPGQEGGPSGGTRGACLRRLAWRFRRFGRRSRRSLWKFGIGARELSREGIVFLSPGRDERPQWVWPRTSWVSRAGRR